MMQTKAWQKKNAAALKAIPNKAIDDGPPPDADFGPPPADGFGPPPADDVDSPPPAGMTPKEQRLAHKREEAQRKKDSKESSRNVVIFTGRALVEILRD